MGVKSTIFLSREQAETKFVDLMIDARLNEIRIMLKERACQMSASDLTSILADLNDEARGGEGFENYAITL
jgi:type I restriction-modification system DNA methylase subunit